MDSSRATSTQLGSRPFTVQVWYPAVRGSGHPAPYLIEPGLLDSMMAHKYMDLEPDQMRGWGGVMLAARLDATPLPPAAAQGWPVLLFSHGLGMARAHYSALCQELASHGYVVVAVDHPIGGFGFDTRGGVLTPGVQKLHYPDHPLRSVVRDWALDAEFILRRLTTDGRLGLEQGRRLELDTARMGMLGHSIGGAAALEACRSGTLFRACVDMDGSPLGEVEGQGVGRPFLVLLSEPDHRKQAPPRDSAEAAGRREFARMGRQRDSSWAAIAAQHPDQPSFVVKVRGTGHLSYSDAPYQMPTLLAGVGATLTPDRMYQITSRYLRAFFDHFLRGGRLGFLRPGPTEVH